MNLVSPMGSTSPTFSHPLTCKMNLRESASGSSQHAKIMRASQVLLPKLSVHFSSLCTYLPEHPHSFASPHSLAFISPSLLFFFSWAAELRRQSQQLFWTAHSGQPGYPSTSPMYQEAMDSAIQGLSGSCPSNSRQIQAASSVRAAKRQVRNCSWL